MMYSQDWCYNFGHDIWFVIQLPSFDSAENVGRAPRTQRTTRSRLLENEGVPAALLLDSALRSVKFCNTLRERDLENAECNKLSYYIVFSRSTSKSFARPKDFYKLRSSTLHWSNSTLSFSTSPERTTSRRSGWYKLRKSRGPPTVRGLWTLGGRTESLFSFCASHGLGTCAEARQGTTEKILEASNEKAVSATDGWAWPEETLRLYRCAD